MRTNLKQSGNFFSYFQKVYIWISLIVVFVGVFLFVTQAKSHQVNFDTFLEQKHGFTFIIQELQHFNGVAIIEIGLILLILFPIIRLGGAFFEFYAQKDKLYASLSILILCILVFSAFYGAG